MIRIGDRIKIKEDFLTLRVSEDPGINQEMLDYKGMEAIVIGAKKSNNYPGTIYYRLDIDKGKNLWFGSWLEEINYEKKIIEFCTKQCICECSEECAWFENMKKLTSEEGSNSY